MNAVPLTPDLRAAWEAFCLKHPEAWFWSTPAWLEYELAHSGGRDLSFAMVEGGDILAICPLILEGDQFSMEGNPLPWPIAAYPTDGWAIWAMIDELAQKHGVKRAAFRGSPLVAEPGIFRHGYTDISWQSRVIDLTRPERDLHAALRKSYRSLINWGDRNLEIVVSRDRTLSSHYQRLHCQQAGRITRSPRTWFLMEEWEQTGNGLLIGAKMGDWVGFVYLILYKDGAYYASGVSTLPNVMHSLQWAAIRELKKRGVNRYELGWQGHSNSPKEKSISWFKTGFGGGNVPLVAIEKYF
ncbi:MAG: hypothetical protein ACE5JS_22010 [Nitrospinota bacterium]